MSPEELKNNIYKLEQHELIQLFDKLKELNVKYTHNRHGVFIRDDQINTSIRSVMIEFVSERIKEHELRYS
jgi:hypothetical protein